MSNRSFIVKYNFEYLTLVFQFNSYTRQLDVAHKLVIICFQHKKILGNPVHTRQVHKVYAT